MDKLVDMSSESDRLMKLIKPLGKRLAYVFTGEDVETLRRDLLGDVDLVVNRESIGRIHADVETVCNSLRMRIVQLLQHEQCAYYFVLTWFEEEDWRYLKLDICSDYLRNARLLMTADELLAGRQQDEETGYFIPPAEKNFLYYLLKKIDKGQLTAEQLDYLCTNLADCRQDVLSELRRFWTESQSLEIIQCVTSGDLDMFRERIPSWQSALRRRTSVSVKSLYQESIRIIKRVIHPSGAWIAIYGPDGSGKSSVISRLVPAMLPAFRKTSVTHFRPRIGAAADDGSGIVVDPHGKPPRHPATSVLKIIYYAADYMTGFLLKVLPAKIRSTFVVFDRYYDDLIIDSRRYCYGGPKWWLRAVRPLIPKPDLVFCLDADPEILQERKAEVSFEESKRQRDAYRDLAKRLPNGHLVDASQPLENVVSDVQTIVLNYMAARTAKK